MGCQDFFSLGSCLLISFSQKKQNSFVVKYFSFVYISISIPIHLFINWFLTSFHDFSLSLSLSYYLLTRSSPREICPLRSIIPISQAVNFSHYLVRKPWLHISSQTQYTVFGILSTGQKVRRGGGSVFSRSTEIVWQTVLTSLMICTSSELLPINSRIWLKGGASWTCRKRVAP